MLHRHLLIALSLLLLLAVPARAQAPAAPPQTERQPAAKPVYDEAADAQRPIAEALARAKHNNTRVLIQWGANWCGWCIRLHDLYTTNKEVARKLQYEYEVVMVDIGKWNRHMDLAAGYGAALKESGVPFLTVLAADGAVVAHQETGSLEIPKEAGPAGGKPGHDPAKVLAFLGRHQAPALAAESVLSDGLAAARRENKRVFLHFGAPWCIWCRRLESWMAAPEVAAILEKQFVDVRIDQDRMIGGKDLLARFTEGRQTGIPWFAFLDPDGHVLATSEWPTGNIGFPQADNEIAHFRTMLDAAAALSDEDEASLAASLVKTRRPPAAPSAH